jgi:hypothetical protein
LIEPFPIRLILPEKLAVVSPVPAVPSLPPSVPMTLMAPSFSKYWLPTLLPAAAPVTVQLVLVVDWAAKLGAALTKISPWLTKVSEVVNELPVAESLSSIVQLLLPVPVA